MTHEEELRTLAAFELGCNETRLDVMDMGSDTAAISGCDMKATFSRPEGSWKLLTKDVRAAPR